MRAAPLSKYLQVPRAEIVLPAEGDDASLTGVAVELELTKGQLANARNQLALLHGGDDVALVLEARGELDRSRLARFLLAKEVELGCHSRYGICALRSPRLRRDKGLRAGPDEHPRATRSDPFNR